jgi:hypothetical protein
LNLAGDCDARVEHLKNCDPMMPGFMDWKAMMGKKNKGGNFGGAESAPMVGKAKSGKKSRKTAKKGGLKKRTKKSTTVAA